ncbi:MAG: hypothetical protein K2H42_05250 [Alistipes sp.]|nr:hypothetical protein [Alistipes sp.]
MKKLVFFLLAAVALCGCESNDEPCPVTGVELPASSAENPVQPGETVTISGIGFAPDCGILLRSGKTDTEAEILEVTASSLRFRAPIVSGTQSVILTQNGGSWNLGKLVFPQADKIPLQILPKKVSRIQGTDLDTDEDESITTTIRYGYDNEGRIISINEHWEEAYDGIVETGEEESAIEYTADRVTITTHDTSDYTDTNYFELADGRATSYIYNGYNGDNASCVYNSNGYISSIIYTDGDGTMVYTVTDGSLTEMKGIDGSETFERLTYNNDPAQLNNLNIDLFGVGGDTFLQCDEGLQISCLLGINGERFRTLPTKITRKGSDYTETYIYHYTRRGMVNISRKSKYTKSGKVSKS